MLRFLKQINDERGQALVIILVLLVLAGLMITPTLVHAANTMISIRTIEKNVNGLYAAEAGVKYALCNLESGTSNITNINQMEVTVQVEAGDPLVLYFGELIQGDQHSNYLIVDTEIVWDEEVTPPAYKYTISVGWQAEPGAPEIHLKEVGGKLPLGYIYKVGSAEVDGNLACRDPDELFEDGGGACMLNWKLQPPLPSVSEENPVRSQTFYITGEGDIEDYYAWVLASRSDIGKVGEIAGTLYTITATAIYPESGETTGKIVCTVLKQEDGTKNIISWQVSK